VVQDGVTGALRPVGDVEGMAAAAVALLAPDRWRVASAAAEKDARARFATSDVVGSYEAVYTEALAQVR
jgi:sarcosine oxidase gamma subunit